MLQIKGTGKGSFLRTFLKAVFEIAARLVVEIFQVMKLEQFGTSLALGWSSE